MLAGTVSRISSGDPKLIIIGKTELIKEVMKTVFFLFFCSVVLIHAVVCAPVRKPKDILLVPANRLVPVPFAANNYPYQPLPYNSINPNANPQIRGPFDFIGNWIQSSEWFPIEVNVPDAFNNLGNGFQQFTQGVGNGINQFTQGLGNGFQQFTQNVGSGVNGFIRNATQVVPFLGNIIRPRFPSNGNLLILIPTAQAKVDNNGNVLSNNNNNENVKGQLNGLGDDIFVGYP